MPINPYQSPEEVNEPRQWPWRAGWRERRAREDRVRSLIWGLLLLAIVFSALFLQHDWFPPH